MQNSKVGSYFQGLGAMAGQLNDQLRSLLAHHGEKGRGAEDVVRSMLQSVLPRRFSVGTGFIINSLQGASQQSDIVIYDHLWNSPIILPGGVGLFPIECVYSTIEVKGGKHGLSAASIKASAKGMSALRQLGRYKYYRAIGPVPDQKEENQTSRSTIRSKPIFSYYHSKLPPRTYLVALDSKRKDLGRIESALRGAAIQHNALFSAVLSLSGDWILRQRPLPTPTIEFKHQKSNALAWFIRYLLRDLEAFPMLPADMEKYLPDQE